MKVTCPNHGKIDSWDIHIHQDDERVERAVCDKCHEEVRINGEIMRYRTVYKRMVSE